ncbi:MAG TPA: glycosyltransferase family 4 protein [Blastocatellia bacterium]|nr:glycosyltransferase family 4 protein [Blastocatellia bacterium]
MRIAMIVPGPIDRVTGGSIYDRRLKDRLCEKGAQVRIISVPDLAYAASLILSPIISLAVAAKLIGRGYDLIIIDAWAHPCLLPIILACRAARKPRLVLIVHQLRWVERKTAPGARIASAVERASLRSADLIITVSRFMRARIESLAVEPSNVLVAYPGCDGAQAADCETGAEQRAGGLRLLFVGNCTPRKGLEYLIEALSILKDPLISLDVVGDCRFDPAYSERLRRDVEAFDLGGAVRFHGRASGGALRSFYSRADVFVMPSLYEGYGIVYAEAMRAGLPIIATDGGPASEIVRDGENALLVPPADSVSLARAIGRLARDPELRSRMACRSLKLACDLPTWQDTCERIICSIESLLVGCKDRG